MRIMRRDNYLIAMLNKDIVKLSAKVPCLGELPLPFTKSFEWNFQFTTLNWMFSDKFGIRTQFAQDPAALRRRFVLFGVFNIVLMPFILPFLTIYFAFKHAEEFQSKKNYLGPRKWSPEAMWRMREFNELQHVFERR